MIPALANIPRFEELWVEDCQIQSSAFISNEILSITLKEILALFVLYSLENILLTLPPKKFHFA